MVKRRSLADGLTTTPKADPEKEKAFVYEKKAKPEAPKKPAKTSTPRAEREPTESDVPWEEEPERIPERSAARTPLTSRLRSDIGEALKRTSLQRQLAGQTPYAVQDILDAALELWLKEHGYLKD